MEGVVIIFRNKCEFYRDSKCIKKNAFCDLKCDMDGFGGGFTGLSASVRTEEKSKGDPDLENALSSRLHTIAKR
jgi:hypothetical protein